MEDTHVHALDYLSVFRRRKMWLLLPILASVLVGALLVRFLPKQYRSSATIAVAASGVSTSLVGQSAPLDNEERLRAVSQQLLSVSTLATVARDETGPGESPEQAAERMRSAISISFPDPVANTNEIRHLDSFVLSYSDNDPVKAQRITNRLANLFVEEHSKSREQRAEHTSAFIATQLAASQTRLAALEARLRHAKESHIGQLPEQTQANAQALATARGQIDANAASVRSEQERLAMIERQIDALKAGGDVVVTSRAGAPVGDGASAPEARLLALQRELATARETYTDKHPEVVRLEAEVALARKEIVPDRDRPASDRAARLQSDPAYRQLVADRELARLRINELSRADADARRQMAVYQARVESAPMVEQELASVQRDYDLEKQQYADLSAKQHSADIAESVEHTGRGEQFAVLYPASYSAEPVKPVPMRVMLFSLVAGLFVGAALTLGREYLDRSVHNVRELREELDLPVLGTVARIQTV